MCRPKLGPGWLVPALVFALPLLPRAGAAPLTPRYRIVELGALPKTDVVVGTSLNNRGKVVGYAYKHVPPGHGISTFAHAFLWENGKLSPLPTLKGEFSHAAAINDSGDIVGDADSPEAWFPVRWSPTGARATVLSAEAGGASAINARGEVLIQCTAVRQPNGQWEPTERWSLHTTTRQTPIPSPDRRHISLTALNARGEVVGYSHNLNPGSLGGPTEEKGFVWREGRVRWLAGAAEGWSTPVDIDEHGRVVGTFRMKVGPTRACRWEGDQRVDLGTLGGASSRAQAINEQGVIAGWADDAQQKLQACLWVEGKARLLQSLIPPESGITLFNAIDINDRGQVLASGKVEGRTQASFLLTPD